MKTLVKNYNTFFLAKACVLLGLSSWLTVAVFNNITDFGTNSYLIREMMNMHATKAEHFLGQGLEWRSIDLLIVSKIALSSIIILQLFVASLLWRSALSWLKIAKNKDITQKINANKPSDQSIDHVVSKTNIALICFVGLWFFFWIGGLWFGYWLKIPQVQQVHMSLIMLSIIVFIFINLPQRSHHDSIA